MCGAILFPNTRAIWRNGKESILAYAQFESYLKLSQLQHAFVRNSLFKEHCYYFIPFVIEPSSTSLLLSSVASFVVFDVLGIL